MSCGSRVETVSAIWRPRQAFGNLVFTDAGWSSSVARWAHNPEVAGSNPAPATKARGPFSNRGRAFCMRSANGFVNLRFVHPRLASRPSDLERGQRPGDGQPGE